MPNELKIVIDADIKKGVAGIKEFSKVVSGEFNKAIGSVSSLEKSITDSISKINSSLSGLKVTSLDVSVNTSQIDAGIKSIQSKFATLVDPKIDILANSTQAEATIKDLIADISALKGSEIFIRANDTQALKVLNEVEAELNDLVGKNISLNVTANLSKLEELKAKISSIKVAPIDVSINASSIDSSIKSIQSKFAAIVDPELNVLANTELAETKIKELLAELSSLQDSEVFIRANDTQALGKIQEIKAELGSLLDRQIRLNINTTEASQKLALLETELLDLQNLSIDPNISSTQLELFRANIERLKKEIAVLKGEAVVLPIEANTSLAQKNINTLSNTIEQLKSKIARFKSFIEVETDITKVIAYNKEVEKLESQMRQLQNVGKKGFEIFVVPNQTIQSVKSLKDAVVSFGGGVKTFIPPAINSFSKLSPAINSAANSLQKFPSAANASSFAMLNFGRVIQDAPFGILGIANNLNPLIESLGRASAAAKETGTSLGKNLIGSLSGAAGIGLVVSLVSSAAIVFSNFFRTTKDGSEDISVLKERFDSLASAIDIAKENIDAFKTALEFGSEFFTIGESSASVLNLQRQQQSKLIDEIKRQKVAADNAVGELLSSTNTANLGKEAFKEFQNTLRDSQKKVLDLEREQFDAEGKLLIINRKLQEQYFDDVKALRDKALADFEKFQNETISKARQFTKEFGDSFVLPNLEDSFFSSKDQLFKASVNLLATVKKELSKQAALTNLEIKLPVLFTTETRLDDSDLKKFLRGEITRDQVKEIRVRVPIVTDFDIQLAQSLIKEFEPTKDLIDNFFKGIQLEREIPIEVTPDLTLAKGSLDAIDKKLDLRKQFSVLGDLGLKEFAKIDFTNINAGISEATKRLQGMMDIANTLNQAIGQGLSSAFNAVFDAVLEGKSVFKALGQAIKELVVGTIKAIAQMLILKAITNLIFPGGGAAASGVGRIFGSGFAGGGFGGQANFGFGGIGSSSFQNSLTVNVIGQISNDTIRLSNQRSTNSSGRYG